MNIEPTRLMNIEQVKSYGIGIAGVVYGWVSKVLEFGYSVSYTDIVGFTQDATIFAGFALVMVRLRIDVRKWRRGEKVKNVDPE